MEVHDAAQIDLHSTGKPAEIFFFPIIYSQLAPISHNEKLGRVIVNWVPRC